MNISIVARHMEVTNAMRAHAEDKLSKLPRLYDGLQSVELTLDSEAGSYTVEIVATGKRKSVFVARHRADDLYGSLDQCVHKLEEQLRRHKDRVRDHQGPPHDQTMASPPPETSDDSTK